MNSDFVFVAGCAGRLDKALREFLSEQACCTQVTRSQIKNAIECGNVRINGAAAGKAGVLLKPGDQVEISLYRPDSAAIEGYDYKLDVIYEDRSVVVINKPAGLSMHPGAGNRSRTLINALVEYYRRGAGELPDIFAPQARGEPEHVGSSPAERPGIVHRLDKDTTGVVVVAKNVQAHAVLSRQFSSRTIDRAYLALVFCTPRARRAVNLSDSGVVEAGIGRHPGRRTEMSVRREGGRPALTHWKVMERMRYGCLVELRLATGRTHQIRVHMSHIGSPVIGDRVYGDFSGLPAPLKREHERFARQALHAYLLEFDHPETGRRVKFSSPLPDEMNELLTVFREYREA